MPSDSTNTLLDLIHAEQERRKAQAPSHRVLFRFCDTTDEEWAAEIEAKRRSGELGPHTQVITCPFPGTRAEGPPPRKLV